MKTAWWAVGGVAAAVLVACGGGGGGDASISASGTTVNASGASAGGGSSGSISAFGSVFVNGHEFSTDRAVVVDDDAGTRDASMSSLEVGMSVDVVPDNKSTTATPVASEIHVHPLARGYVDASDITAGTLTVMGQAVKIGSSTLFVDRRGCLSTTPATCSAITGQSGLTATTGSGGTAVPGHYVGVHGYLYSGNSTPATSTIVASLVYVGDVPSGTPAVKFKAEGLVSAVSSSGISIGGLTVGLGSATCFASGAPTACATAYSVGNVVSVFAGATPSLPVASFSAEKARLVKRLTVETAGAAVELEGKVSSVGTTSFVLRGITVDASGLPTGTSLPSAGDEVKVLGTVASGGASVKATSLTVLHSEHAQAFGFESDFTSVVPGATAGTYTLTMMGQAIKVNARTRLADHSASRSGLMSNPFNANTFKDYLTASASKHLMVLATAEAGGALTARSVTVMPARSVFAVAGTVDATPTPVNGAGAALTTFSVHGLPVSAAPTAVVRKLRGAGTTVAAGDLVLVRGTFDGTTLSVAAPTGSTPPEFQIVIDRGTPRGDDDLF